MKNNSNNIDSSHYRIFKVQGENCEPCSTIKQGEVYIIIDESNNIIWIWQSNASKMFDRYQARIQAGKIKEKERKFKFKIEIIREGQEPPLFLEISSFIGYDNNVKSSPLAPLYRDNYTTIYGDEETFKRQEGPNLSEIIRFTFTEIAKIDSTKDKLRGYLNELDKKIENLKLILSGWLSI